jgi:hypothetical protein
VNNFKYVLLVREKIEPFKKMNLGVESTIVMHDALQKHFGYNLSNEVNGDIYERYSTKTYVCHDQKEAT